MRLKRSDAVEQLHIEGTLRAVSWYWLLKDKILEADSKLEISMTVCQGIDKMP